MTTDQNPRLEELKRRAAERDPLAVKELREMGYFKKRWAEEGYAVSHAQRRLWFLHRMDQRQWAYNVPSALLVEGDLRPEHLRAAFRLTARRHESLRTTVSAVKGEPRQFVHDEEPALEVVDLSGEPDAEGRAAEMMRRDAGAPFDLAAGPLVRAMLLTVAPLRHLLYLNLHHIICDEQSFEVLVGELFTLYGQLERGEQPRPAALDFQYKEYAARQNEQLRTEWVEEERAYWLGKLAGAASGLNLPTDFPRPPEMTYNGADVTLEFGADVAAGLAELSRARQASLFDTLTALTKVLLHRYTSQEDIVVGVPVTGRDDARLDNQIGFYVNTVALRDEVCGRHDFLSVLASVRRTKIEAQRHGRYPFDMVVKDLRLERDLGRTPLFDVSVALYNEESSRLDLGGLSISPYDLGFATAKFDLSFNYTAGPAVLRLRLNYNTDLFRAETVERMAGNLERLARAALDDPGRPVGELEMLGEEERRELLRASVSDAASPPDDKTIVELFEEQAARTPDNVAVVSGETRLTYRELNRRANRIAHDLRARHETGAEQFVAVMLGPSEWLMAALLGVLKAGAAYVPLDPTYPAERLRHVLEDCGARVLIAEESCAALVEELAPGGGSVEAVDVRAASGGEDNPAPSARPDNAAYVIYTSGSTGGPKGCVVTHRNVVRLLKNEMFRFDFGERDVWVAAHSFCFDFSVWEMYGALLYGGRLVVPAREQVRDPGQFLALLEQHRVTILNQTPAAFYNLMREEGAREERRLDAHLRCVILGGDRLEPSYLRPWAERYAPERVALVNMYGITETTVHVTHCRLRADDIFGPAGRNPVGAPLPGVSVYVLNDALRLQPAGVAGEIYVGGAGVSRGYLNRPGLTAERFVENPYRAGERLYRSGDLGRWLAGGALEHLGRNDDQVQLNGFRIELREIEKWLLAYPPVERALLLAGDTPEGLRELTAYVVAGRRVTVEELRRRLRASLPEYMIPAHFVQIDELPLTPNNKIDYKALPRPGAARAEREGAYVAPRDRVEHALAEVWARVLNCKEVGVNDDYFNLGGDSIKVIRLIDAIEAQLGASLAIKDIFRCPTVAELAAHLRRTEFQQAPADELAAAHRRLDELKRSVLDSPRERALLPEDWEDFYPMSDIEQGMVFHSVVQSGEGVYHDQFVYQLRDDAFDLRRLSEALTLLTRRHPILRTSFHVGGFREPMQVVHRRPRVELSYEDWSGAGREQQTLRLREFLNADMRRPFEFTRPGLSRHYVFRLSEDEYSLVMVFHHSILDGWSNATLFTELFRTYTRLKEEPDYAPAPLKATYRDFVADQLRWKESEEMKAFWARELAEYEHTHLPFGRSAEAGRAGGERRYVTMRFQPDLCGMLLSLSRDERVGIKDTYLAAFVYLLQMVTGKSDLLFGLVSNNRPAIPDGDAVIGCFLNSLPFRYLHPPPCTTRELLRSVRDKSRALKAYELFPMRRIAELAGLNPNEGNQLFDVLFNYIDFHVFEEVTKRERAEAGPSVDSGMVKGNDSTNTLFDFGVSGTFGNFFLTISYQSGLFAEAEVERLADYYRRILECFAEGAGEVLTRERVLREEADVLLGRFNDTARPYPRESTVAAVFEAVAARSPERPAVSHKGRELTYRELNDRANAVARVLLDECGLAPEECVGVLLDRSELTAAALVGILKAGGAYVPLDPRHPRERVEYILRETGCRYVLSAGARLETLEGMEGVRALDLGRAPAGEGLANPAPRGDGSSLAYVIYTSGSTGRPKGSLIEQRSVLRLVLNTDYIEVSESDRVLHAGSLAFDVSTLEIWGALLNGACVVLPEEGTQLEPARYRALLEAERVTVIALTTSLFNQFVEADIDIFRVPRVLVTGGEQASVRHFNRVHADCPGLTLVHIYGPTENTCISTSLTVARPYDSDVPIGGPIANSTAHILDRHLQLLPVGVPGEIYTGGDGVARGYVNDAELSARKFIDDPFRPGGRLYRTGDLGLWLADGSIRFLGRGDKQIKVRGFRVEPGEIEYQMRAHESVREAVVLVRDTPVGTKELIAYYTSADGLESGALRSFLENFLPPYMVPGHLLRLEKMPLDTTGKVDRRALPAPEEFERPEPDETRAPRDERERLLAGVWGEVLGRRDIGIHDDYFLLGGDSIKAIQINSRLRQSGWRLKVKDLFVHKTIARVAPALTRSTGADDHAPVTGDVPLTPIQHSFFRETTGDLSHFNQAVLLRADERLDETALRAALQKIWEHHDALRIVFRDSAEPERVRQINLDAASPFALEVIDLAGAPDARAAVEAHADGLQSSLSLEDGPLVKAALYRLGDADQLLIVIHHLVIDGVSWRILLEDLERGYAQCARGARPDLGGKTHSFAAWAEHLKRFAESGECRAESLYWNGLDTDGAAALPVDDAGGENVYGVCRSEQVRLGEAETSDLLSGVHHAYDTEINDILLTALGRALRRWHGGAATLVSLEGHGREPLEEKIDVTRTVGWFTTIFPFRLELSGDDIGGHIRRVRDDLRRIPRKGIGHGLLKYLAPGDAGGVLRSRPAPLVSFNYLGEFGTGGGGDSAGVFTLADDAPGRAISPSMPRPTLLDLVGVVLGGRLHFSLVYSTAQYERRTIESLLAWFREELDSVVEHCKRKRPDGESATAAPSFSAALSAEDYESIMGEIQ